MIEITQDHVAKLWWFLLAAHAAECLFVFFIRARQGRKDEPAFVALTCLFIMAAGFP
eukprot:CAMPEP_0182546298 /NCGR_PEP_ID=MMETSP1323-20130603/35846_1 /TAXON_ID=236787 /ORGANISM="Florenciella parvula, Strain RCC1693" /LENGTH=56 /DNA_ID=CAMNT_0024757513 /DNA_START=37 /DNA_END=204 /DNA_ORIENTATION=-